MSTVIHKSFIGAENMRYTLFTNASGRSGIRVVDADAESEGHVDGHVITNFYGTFEKAEKSFSELEVKAV